MKSTSPENLTANEKNTEQQIETKIETEIEQQGEEIQVQATTKVKAEKEQVKVSQQPTKQLEIGLGMTTKTFNSVLALKLNELFVICNPNGITFRGLNESNVMIQELFFNKNILKNYDFKGNEKFAISVDDFRQLKLGGKDTNLNFNCNTNKLEISSSADDREQKFFFSFLEGDTDKDKEFPNLDFPKRFGMSSMDLKNAITDIKLCSETFKIGSDENDNLFLMGNDVLRQVVISFKTPKKNLFEFSKKEKAISSFSVDFLLDIMRGIRISDKCEIYLGNNYPIKIKFVSEDNNVVFTSLLAPRNEE